MTEVGDDRVHQIENLEGAVTPAEKEALRADVIMALKGVFDPEIPVDIYELGLVYSFDISDAGFVRVQMTLTSPGCPVAGSLPGEVEARVSDVPGVQGASVELVWDPPWSREMMSEVAQLELGLL